ncbi:hypothetical protein Y1Q_0001857 [Alligator mississippiensis]|uniref:Uncharacterized protein n=1 Tax=Alligator mississippiensis TaxID=8496 RepID=A0A151PG95_ALLMI|nr:hypothetical protein Y1Q_0001857 [Alligator mississippiensis]
MLLSVFGLVHCLQRQEEVPFIPLLAGIRDWPPSGEGTAIPSALCQPRRRAVLLWGEPLLKLGPVWTARVPAGIAGLRTKLLYWETEARLTPSSRTPGWQERR